MKNVIITGGGKRLGRHLALNFAKNGYNVVIHYNTSYEMAKTTHQDILNMGVDSIMIKADLRNLGEIERLFNTASTHYGKLDVLVNSAAVLPRQMPVSEITELDWEDIMNVNLKAYLFASQQFAKYVSDSAKIINIASLGGQEIWKNRLLYNVSKAGVIQLTKALAREFAPKIAVNSVSPGIVSIPDEPSENDTLNPNRIPYGRYATPEEIFEAVLFFAECSNYITAQNLNVDGGYHDAR
jgi:NAD(P)-dependent dehydrogenase (short-subunit alcohol dehydrogenase family)